jgi:hypothetical protein
MPELNEPIKQLVISQDEIINLLKDIELLILIFEKFNPDTSEFPIAYTINKKLLNERSSKYDNQIRQEN